MKATGREITEEDYVHIWYFDQFGRVTRFRHRVDTLLHATAYRGK